MVQVRDHLYFSQPVFEETEWWWERTRYQIGHFWYEIEYAIPFPSTLVEGISPARYVKRPGPLLLLRLQKQILNNS